MHVLPRVRQLEEAFPDDLVVIGVHAGKYWEERITENIFQATRRLGIEHPVVNDRFFRVWRSYAVNAWPTLVLVNPQGYVVDTHPGEIMVESYQPFLARVVEEARRKGAMTAGPAPIEPQTYEEPARPLRYPGKVATDGQGHIFVADSSHHRVIILALNDDGLSARVEAMIGRSQPGFEDGDFQSAAFNYPQGIVSVNGSLYVADTGNHALRKVDLAGAEVTTVASGDGRGGGIIGIARRPIRSPWDLAVRGRGLYVAMAGTHQLWRLDLGTEEFRPYAGTGAEEIVDGQAHMAALAQPSGLSMDHEHLAFADSESNAIRIVDLPPGTAVTTLVGTGLFDFGDVDGTGDEVRLQHPLGVAWHDGTIYVADTYNHKIKALDPATRECRTLVGTGEAGYADGSDAQFYEPGGLCALDGRLYVADTNNHAIRVVDIKARTVTTLEIEGLAPI